MPYLRHAFVLLLALSTACSYQKAAYQMSDTMIARPQQEDDRKILYDANLTLTVETPDSTSGVFQK